MERENRIDSSVVSSERASSENVPSEPAPWWRRLLRRPLLWAVLCGALALPWYLDGNGLELLPFLLTLAFGWLCALAFVNFTLRMTKTKRGALLHVAGAVVVGYALWWGVFGEGKDWADASETVRALIFLVTMALIPAAAWIWLGLLGRVSSVRWVQPTKATSDRIPPEWERNRVGSLIRFSAVPMRIRTLGIVIAVVIIVVGSISVAVLLATDLLRHISSWRVIAVLFGTVIALPTYAIVTALLKTKSVACSVQFEQRHVRVQRGTDQVVIAFHDLDRLVWRCNSDYARLEARGGGQQVCLITGIARTPSTILPRLPPLPREIVAGLSAAGLEEQKSRKVDLTVFTRRAVADGTQAS